MPLDRWGLPESRLVELLGEPAESLAERLDRPGWLSVLEAARRDASPPGEGPATLLEPVRPLLDLARREVPGFEPPEGLLARMVAPTVSLEINVAREEGRLRAESPEAAFEEFCASLRDDSLGFLLEYPVLAASLVETVLTWIDVRREFLRRLADDLPDLCRTFGVDGPPVEVRFGAGDSHRGGRSVAICEFAGGRRVVYKPRRVDPDLAYGAFLRWLSARGLPHELKVLEVLPRDGYGWVEFVSPRPCTDRAEVERFFWRQGAHLAVFHALCGSDLHFENVIAAGEHPVIVDVETLFQATPRMFGLADAEPLLTAAVRVTRDSVLRVGLLPDHVVRTGESGSYGADISGLTGGGGQLSMLPSLVLQGRGTDRMRMTRERLPLSEVGGDPADGAGNRALLGDEPVDLADHRDDLVAGFTACYELMLRHRAKLLGPGGPLDAFRDAPVRALLRPTATYAKLLGESWHPDLLRDALDREHLFESLAVALQGIDVKDAILESEIRQLAAGDIPLFEAQAGSVDLCDDAGRVVPDFFERSGLAAARERISGLSIADLERQRWFIDASLTGLTLGEFSGPGVADREPVPLPEEPISRSHALLAAGRIADQLLDSALTDEACPAPSWLSITFAGDRYWTVAPTAGDLYGGLAGIALFLAELSAMGGGSRFRDPAVRMTEHLCDVADLLAGQGLLVSTLGVSGFTGLGGLAYVLAELGRLWSSPALTERAYGLAGACADACREDRSPDLLGGAAGAALVFAGLHRRAPSERTLAVLEAAGRTIADRALDVDGAAAWPTDMESNRPLLGLSHGPSGIAVALAAIASVPELAGREAYADLALRGLRHERRHLSREHGNWPDLRSFVVGTEYRNTWCHGAAGIGLGRAALLRSGLDADTSVTEDLEIAVRTVCRDLMPDGEYVGRGNDSLCHGDLGLVETLSAASDVLERPELSLLGRRIARAVADRVLTGGARCGTPDGLSTPGLMLGVAGLGYGLLRAAAPDELPNVLLLSQV